MKLHKHITDNYPEEMKEELKKTNPILIYTNINPQIKNVFTKENYDLTKIAIKLLASIAINNKWKLPKGRFDMKLTEIIQDKKFTNSIVDYINKFKK